MTSQPHDSGPRVLIIGDPDGRAELTQALGTGLGASWTTAGASPDDADLGDRLRAGEHDLVLVDDTVDVAVVPTVRGAAPMLPIVVITRGLDARGLDALHAAGITDFVDRAEIVAGGLATRLCHAVHRASGLRQHGRDIAARDELLSIVAHDLRGPLSTVSVAVGELADGTLDADARTRYVAAARRAMTRADRLLSTLLDLARIEAGTFRVELSTVNLGRLLRQAAKDHEPAAADARARLEVDAPDDLQVRADRDRVLQVLGHLIGNALRHARGSEVVELAARPAPAGGGLEVIVADHGPGIPARMRPHVFDRFWHDPEQRRGGARLGLAIARGIVVAHGGAIGVDSSEGKGARFWFTLPTA